MPKPRSTPFRAAYGLKYGKTAECLAKDRRALLAFYDFPAEHWKHLSVRRQGFRATGWVN